MLPRLGRLAFLLGKDRKSTRLNSSHSQISYAVFCLKKKNRIIAIPASGCARRHLPMPIHLIEPCDVLGAAGLWLRERIVREFDRALSARGVGSVVP